MDSEQAAGKDAAQMDFDEIMERERLRQENTMKFLSQVFSKALDILSDRILLLIAMACTASLFFWTMTEPTGLRLGAAVLFACLVNGPMLWVFKTRKR